MKQIRKRLTYANVMSSIAVFLVIGGATAFAALGKNTVGTKQLKKNAVVTAKIKKEAVTGAKIAKGTITSTNLSPSALGTVPSATNAAHAVTADNATHANSATNADSATQAASASAPATLASHQTLRGHYHIEFNSGTGGGTGPDLGQGYSYIFPLASTPTGHFIPAGTTPPSQCPGSVSNPQAAPGNLCVYEGSNHSNDSVSIGSESDKYGFGLLLLITGGEKFGWSIGSWAVTAP